MTTNSTSSTTSIVYYYTGIANYDKIFNENDINILNSRPNAESDFVDGKTTVNANDYVIWGQDIGYRYYHY